MATSTLLSIQVGKPVERDADSLSDQVWQSSFLRTPVEGSVWLGKESLEGNQQADTKNHGGEFMVVLVYNAEHYPVWREELNLPDMAYGSFGENFTVSELTETTVCIGDIYQIGESVKVEVSQPRLPCWKLNRHWEIEDLSKQVDEKRWPGWYFRVLQEGHVEAGQSLTLLERPCPQYTIDRVFTLMNKWEDDAAALAELANLEPISPEWRGRFAERSGR
jgi:MOSC domain-containing protein YiiM